MYYAATRVELYWLRNGAEVWNGISAIDGTEREVDDGIPEGGEVPDLSPAPPLYVPNVDTEDIEEIAKRL